MRMNKTANYLILFLTFVLLQACSPVADSQSRTDVEGRALIGHYIYGHEVNSFQPCSKKEVFWVKGSNELLEFMARKYSEHATQPYDEVYVEIIGNFESKATDGFAADYDGQIHVMKMVLMKKKSDTDCK
jgi:hypothetical protein